jgi:amidase
MARTAEDLELALKVLSGPEGRDATAYRLDLPQPRHDALSGYRVFVLTQHPTAVVDDEIVGAIDALAAGLEKAGASVTRESPLLPSLADSHALVEKFAWTYKTGMNPDAPEPKGTVKDYYDCLIAQEMLRRRWDDFFKAFDVVIAPCHATPAFKQFADHDPWPGLNRTLRVNGADAPFAPQTAWPLIAGMPHLPATAAPIGRTRDGLPIGAQFIGPFLEDLTTIAFAGQVATAFGVRAEVAIPNTLSRREREGPAA